MLNDFDTARDLAPLVAKAHPEWAQSLTPQTGPEMDRWKFRAALLIALHAQFQPLVRVNDRTELNTGSWWCPVTAPSSDLTRTQDDENAWIAWRLPVIFTPLDTALSQTERETASREIKQLQEKGSAQSFIAPIIFDWATNHPDDSRVPEALHRLVVVTRYGCSDADPSSGQVSKTAFDMLHKRYPKSPWTARTPYWF
jgi:hypothetical protein